MLQALDTLGNYRYSRNGGVLSVDSIKHCEKWLPRSNIVFEKEVISYSNIKTLQV